MVSPAPPTKWVVPGRSKAVWEDPTLRRAAPRPRADLRFVVALVLAAAALALGLLVIRLSRAAAPAPGPGSRPPAAFPAVPASGVYESENVRIEFRAPAEDAVEAKEESP